MGPNRERLLDYFSTSVAFLRSEARVDSDDLMTSSCSLIFKDVEKRAPTGVEDGLCQVMILHHIGNLKVFDRDLVILFRIVFGYVEMMVTALPMNLEMGPGHVARSFTAPLAAFLAAAKHALLASECLLVLAIVPGVLNGPSLAIGEEAFESHVKADSRMLTYRWVMLRLCLYLADNQGIPMSISPQHQMRRFRGSLYRSMQLDLEDMAELLWHDQILLVLMKRTVFAILPKLDGVPAVRGLEAREAHANDAKLPGSKKAFERFGEPISEHLDGGGWYVFTLPFEHRLQFILGGKRASLLILRFDLCEQGIVNVPRLAQAGHQQATLLWLWIQSIFKRSHRPILKNP